MFPALLTYFTIPKSFQGHTSIIQRNALQSWMKSMPTCEIILCGDDPGVSETARELGLRHVAIDRNSFGTPLLSSAFHQVQKLARNPFICYINADIIMASDIAKAIEMIPFKKFIMVGQRWDMDIKDPIDFSSPDWAASLEKQRNHRGILEPPDAIDYFVFPRGAIGDLPPFAVGRPGWDNWLIYQSRAERLPVIDATQVVTIIHQNHGYDHVPSRRGNTWEGPEGDRNRDLAGGPETRFTIHDATWILTHDGIKRSRTPSHLKRILPAMSALHPRMHALTNGLATLVSLPSRTYAALKHRLSIMIK